MAEKKERQYVSDIARLMDEWNWKKNNNLGLSPYNLTYGSNKKAWWMCCNGHEWQACINDRNKRNRGCPYCAGQKAIVGKNDLKTINPSLAQEWNYIKNTGLSPENVMLYSNKRVWWKCNNGHEWQAVISHRNKSQGCPICSGKIILAGFNDLTTTHPLLVEEWDYEKNIDILPTEVSKGSEKKVWWICSRGHSWCAAVYSRVSGVGCPHCAKELQSSFPEKAIFFYIKRIFPDAIANYRTKQIKSLELDIFIPSLQIGVEYDGERWHRTIEKDLQKNKLCKKIGISLIRIREPACPALLDELSLCIIRESKKTGLNKTIMCLLETICKMASIECAIEVDIDSDRIAILELLNPSEKENGISQLAPHLVNEWDYQKNGNLRPNMITIGSDKKVWWICPKGHSYSASSTSRVRGRGCPICKGKKC